MEDLEEEEEETLEVKVEEDTLVVHPAVYMVVRQEALHQEVSRAEVTAEEEEQEEVGTLEEVMVEAVKYQVILVVVTPLVH